MFDMNELFRAAQGGHSVENFARQFGLPQNAVQSAMEALAPAFAAGMARNMGDPFGMQSFMSAMQSGRHKNYFSDPMAAFAPSARQDGDGILGQLFGSKDFSRALADQVGAMTGVGSDVLRQMLPAMANMMMGGLQQNAMANPMADAMQAFLDGFTRGRPEPKAEPETKQPAASDIMDAFFSGFTGGATPSAGKSSGNPMLDMMQAGQEAQKDNMAAFEDLFSKFWSAPKR